MKITLTLELDADTLLKLEQIANNKDMDLEDLLVQILSEAA